MPESTESVIKAILADLEHDVRVNLHRYPIQVALQDGSLALDGVVEDIAAKRIARHAAHRHAGHLPVLDRLRVEVPPAEGVSHSRDEVVNVLLDEPDFKECGLRVRDGEELRILRPGSGAWGERVIEVEARDGSVILSGEVLSLTHRRLAEVLAWWVGGCERVENLLHVVPPERETDDELANAVQIVLQKDPLVQADDLAVTVREGQVTLAGRVASQEERRLALQDVWYIPGVLSNSHFEIH
jgi:osmotically-inducible protein OsmY